MSGRTRLTLAAIIALAALLAVLLLAFASNACATDLPGHPCPAAGTNRAIVVVLGAMIAGLLLVPFAFLAEFALRRRIVYRGAWGRALRRGLLVGLAVAAVAGLRLGGTLSVPSALFVVVMVVLLEWFAFRRFDAP